MWLGGGATEQAKSPHSVSASCGHPSPPLTDLKDRILGDEDNPGSAQALLRWRKSMLRRQARNPEVLGVGWEVGVWQKPVSGCPLLDIACNCIPTHPRYPQLCSRRPGILPASGSPSPPSLFLHPPPQIPLTGFQSHVRGRGPSRTVLWSGEARSARLGIQGLTSRQQALSQTPLCPG